MTVHRSTILVGTLCGVLLGAPSSRADTIHVPGDYPTIQAGIDAAVDGDEVVVADGEYRGPGNRRISFDGKAITVRSVSGPDECVVDCEGAGIGFLFLDNEGPDSVLEGFTVTNGAGFFGGAVSCRGSSPTIRGCVLIGNCAEWRGGGVLSEDGGPLIVDCTIAMNRADVVAGGVGCVSSQAVILDCVITGNSAFYQGGGVSSDFSSCVTIAGCTVSDNVAEFVGGGGIACDTSEMLIIDCIVLGNADLSKPPSVHGGGGILSDVGATCTIVNCLIAENTSRRGGGLNVCDFPGQTIINCTIVGNTSEQGGAIYVFHNDNSSIANSILWDNTPQEIYLADGSITVHHSNVRGGWSGSGNINAPPRFVDAPKGNLRLASGSPCIDAGANDAVPPEVLQDLDGNPRFFDDPDTDDTGSGEPPIVDMGAYEFQGASCPADLDDSGTIGFADLIALLSAWGPCPHHAGCPEDLDDDGTVGFSDLLILLAAWGPCE